MHWLLTQLARLGKSLRTTLTTINTRTRPARQRAWRHLQIRSRLAWRRLGRTSWVQTLKANPLAIIQGIILLGLAIWLGLKLDSGIKSGWNKIKTISLPSPTLTSWIGLLLVLAIIALGIWIYQKGWRHPVGVAQRATGWIPVGKILKLALTVGFLWMLWFFAGPTIKSWFDGGIVVGTGWSKLIQVPQGEMPIWTPRHNVAYEIVTMYKERKPIKHVFPRVVIDGSEGDCDGYQWVPEKFSSFKLRVVDKEIQSTIFDITFTDFKLGGLCAEKTVTLPASQPKLEIIPIAPPSRRVPPNILRTSSGS